MFWRFGFNNPSAIDGLLEQPDVSLEEILSDQDIIQEAKSQNPKLIEFLLKKENISHLIALFFSLEIDKQRLPLIACEILACEIPQLIDAIVIENVDLLEDFWNFLNIPYSADATYSFQASYFVKIMTIFLTKRTVEMLDFIKSTPDNVTKILQHLQSSAIMDLLLTLVRLEELPEAKGTVQWLNDNGLLANLIGRLDPTLEVEEHSTAQSCICEIVRMSQTSLLESPSIGMNDFILQLTSRETMTTLVKYMLSQEANATSTLINGVAIIIDIIRHNNSDMDNEQHVMMGYGQQVQKPAVISLADMLSVLTEHIKDFNNLLIHPKTTKIPFRESLPIPLGFERLKICELFAELLHCSNMSTLNTDTTSGDDLKLAYVQHQVLPTCIELFFRFPWNNFLHYVVYDMLHQVFNGQMTKESNRQLAITIFTEGKLTNKIVEAQEKNDQVCAEPKGMRLGYMGHLTFISDEIIKLFEGYPESVILAVKDSIDLDKWQAYCQHQLKDTKERDNLPLGEIKMNGTHTVLHHDDDEDDDEEEEEDEEAEIAALNRFDHLGTAEEEHSDDDEHISNQSWITGRDDFTFTRQNDDSDEEEDEDRVDWSGGFIDSFTVKPEDDEDEDEEDPFGDFNSSTENTNWQDGFTSNFTELDIQKQDVVVVKQVESDDEEKA